MSRQPKRDLRKKKRRKRQVRDLWARLERTLGPAEHRRPIANKQKISPAAPMLA